jgi:hypothetical protein
MSTALPSPLAPLLEVLYSELIDNISVIARPSSESMKNLNWPMTPLSSSSSDSKRSAPSSSSSSSSSGSAVHNDFHANAQQLLSPSVAIPIAWLTGGGEVVTSLRRWEMGPPCGRGGVSTPAEIVSNEVMDLVCIRNILILENASDLSLHDHVRTSSTYSGCHDDNNRCTCRPYLATWNQMTKQSDEMTDTATGAPIPMVLPHLDNQILRDDDEDDTNDDFDQQQGDHDELDEEIIDDGHDGTGNGLNGATIHSEPDHEEKSNNSSASSSTSNKSNNHNNGTNGNKRPKSIVNGVFV